MPDVERNVVKAPNEMLRGLGQARSTTPGAGPSATNEPNRMLRDGAPGGSADLSRSASPVAVPDHRFDVDNARMPQPPSVIEPGTGAVPIYGFNSMGVPNRALPEKDSAKK